MQFTIGAVVNERIVAALELREPDRIPLMEWSIHQNVIDGLCPGGGLFDLVEMLDLDGVSVGGRHVPKHREYSEPVFVDSWGTRWGRTSTRMPRLPGRHRP